MASALFAFGPFQFDPLQKILFRGSDVVPIGRRGALILELLLSERGGVVSKERLIDAAWPAQAVEESNLSVHISKLRRAIGPSWIRTIERVGYQFAAIAKGVVPARLPDADGSAFPFLAILGTKLSGDTALDETGNALRNELIAELGRFRSINLIASGGSDRRIDYELTLSMQRRNAMQRAALEISEALSGRILWAQTFDLVPDAAPRMAAGIESAIQSAEYRNGPRRNTPGAEAYGHYLAGRRVLNSSLAHDNATAHACFMAAVELEPENPIYLAAACEAIHHRLGVGWEWLGPDDKRIGRELAYRTLDLAGGDAVVIGLVGNTMFTVDEEDLGLALSRRAVELNPIGQLTLACALHAEYWGGALDAHARFSERATQLAPNDPGQRFALNGRATAARHRGDDQTALDWAYRALAVGRGYSGAHWTVISSLVGLGRQDEAERHLSRYLAIAPGVTAQSIERGQHVADRSRLKPLINRLRQAGLPAR